MTRYQWDRYAAEQVANTLPQIFKWNAQIAKLREELASLEKCKAEYERYIEPFRSPIAKSITPFI